MNLKKEQFRLEAESNRIAYMKVKESIDKTNTSSTPAGVLFIKKVFDKLMDEFNKLDNCKQTTSIKAWRKISKYLSKEQQVYIALKTILDMIDTYPTSYAVQQRIVKHLKAEVEYIRFKEEAPALLYTVESNIRSNSSVHSNRVIQRAKRLVAQIPDEDIAYHAIAHTLIHFLSDMGVASLYRYNKGRKILVEVRPSAELLGFLDDINARVASMDTYDLPMILPPVEWTPKSFYSGGYFNNCIKHTHCFIKNKENELKDYKASEVQKTMDIVNKIQRTPFNINEKVMSVLSSLTSREDDLDGLLPSFQLSEIPPKPWVVAGEEYEVYKQHSPEKVKDWKSRVRDIHTRDVRMQTKKLLLSNQLFVAEKMAKYERIYFPYSIDYRGRVYPLPKFINPQGDDIARGLLTFYEGKEHGEKGLYWFKVYGANLYGKDKISFHKRVAWTNRNWSKIVNSALDPLTNRWWTKADKPFQFLAFCFECAEMKDREDIEYVSHLPVQMDGSCNGLQHFSAMLKDEVGGEAVNLIDSSKPSDVYARVAEVTTSLVKKKKDRQFWWDKIDRSTVKRCVMTTPYGVTEYGMKDQLIEYFQKKRDKGMVLPKVLHKDCIYLAKQIQRAIKRTLRGSIVIKEWLQDNAQHFPEGWMWHTPTGFKVINNPKRYKAKVITTKFLSQIWMRQAGTKGTIDTRRMRNTISPNFVHSMDAAHMGLTVLGMWTEGIRDFSMIHDSFGCHSCYVETMHRVIREQFVQMYAQKDWLAYMRDKVVKQIEKEGGKEEVEVIEQGELDLKEVLTSKYFFS